ncbi:ROK family protein [Candidatus Saccharibacteria bacterium]|nr:ROK family protein [Candidatus Saccharibacteria bacterium]
MSKGVVGLFDIGATRTRLAIATSPHEFSEHVSFATDTTAAGTKQLFDQLRVLVGDCRLTGLAGGVAGQINPQTGTLWHATNLPHWNGIAIGHEFTQAFGVKLAIGNDTAVVGLGEAVFGAGRGHHIVMYETVSTGVNAARITGGVIDEMAQGIEVGAQLILGSDGHLTTLEAATGGAALERKYGHPPRELALQGLWRSEARLLALGLYNSLLHFSPDVVVFGGSMMRDIELRDIERELKKLPLKWPRPVPLLHAQLGDNGGLFGALALARTKGFV